MRAVDTDAVAGEAEESLLLRVCKGERFEATEDDGVVGDHDGGLDGDGFVGDGLGEIDCEEHRVVLSAGGIERCFEQQAGVIPRVVCERLGVAVCV